MFYSDLKQINLIENNSNEATTGSHSFNIDLSNDVLFCIFHRHLTKIPEIETAVIGQNTRARARHKRVKLVFPTA